MNWTTDILNKFYENWRVIWKKYHWIIIVCFLSLLCDAASTIYFMLREGPSIEIHLAIRFVSEIFGPVVGPLIGAAGKAMAAIFVVMYFKRFGPYILLAVTIISFWAAWYNIWGVNIYTPNILKWIPW